jgi:hypothetical protein
VPTETSWKRWAAMVYGADRYPEYKASRKTGSRGRQLLRLCGGLPGGLSVLGGGRLPGSARAQSNLQRA